MEDSYILSTKTHEDWRNYLMVNGFFFYVLIQEIRSGLKLPKNGLKGIQEIYDWERKRMDDLRRKHMSKNIGNKSGTRKLIEHFALEDRVRRELYIPIWEFIEKFYDLNLGFNLIRDFVLGHTKLSFHGSGRVVMITSPEDPIKETGVYIKFTPELSETDMAFLKKQAIEAHQTLFKIRRDSKIKYDKLGKPYVKAEKMKIRKRKSSEPTKEQLKIYLAVENQLIKSYYDNPLSIKIPLVFEEVSSELRMNKGTIQRVYYAVLNNFHLPTSVDTKKIFKTTNR